MAAPRSINALVTLYRSTIGKKIIAALTGLILVGFLVVHMAGNLLMLAGPVEMNHYAEFLKLNAEILWAVRVVLLVSVITHIAVVLQLVSRSRAARPVDYGTRLVKRRSTLFGRTMLWGGLFLALFIVFHLLHLTGGNIGFSTSAVRTIETMDVPVRTVSGGIEIHTVAAKYDVHNVYNNYVFAFRQPMMVIIYVLAMVALFMHLFHGVRSLFQTLGLNHPRWNDLVRKGSIGLAAAIVGGFLLPMIGVIVGAIQPTLLSPGHLPGHLDHQTAAPADAAPVHRPVVIVD